MKRTDINTMLCAERLKELRMAHSFTQKQIGDLIGVSRATVSRYETGTHSPSVSNLKVIADKFRVNRCWLAGISDEQYIPQEKDIITGYKTVPIVSLLAAGKTIFTNTDILGWECVSRDSAIDFCLKIKDNSLINAGIPIDSLVYIRRQTDIKNGDIAVVLLDKNKKTGILKKVYKYKRIIVLRDDYAEKVFNNKDDIYILGKVIAYKTNLK